MAGVPLLNGLPSLGAHDRVVELQPSATMILSSPPWVPSRRWWNRVVA
jgi:hypothetical protein